MNKCPECGSQNISYENYGEESCRECGLVVEENGIEQPFVSEATQSQATHPYLSIAGSKTQEGRIFKSSWMLSTREKNLRAGMSKIDEIASRLNLPKNIIKESRLIFKKSQYSNISIGRDNISLIYASIYMACNIHELPKTLTEITEYSEIRSKDLMKAYRLIKAELGLNTRPIDPLDLLPRFASKLDLSPKTITRVAEIIIQIKDTVVVSGKKPETILAGAIYIAGKQTGEKRTQRQIANTLGVIEITIRKISKEITFYVNYQ